MSVRYHVDPVHSKIRLAALLAFGIGSAIGYLLVIPAILSLTSNVQDWAFCLRLVGAAGLGVLASWGIERLLIPIWPSGRFIDVYSEGISLCGPNGEEAVIKWNEPIKVTAWHFKIQQGGTPVPRGWHCTACLLAQGDTWLAGYSFIKPNDLSSLAGWRAFKELPPRKRPSPFRRDPVQEFPSEEIRIVERYRWNEGCELTPDDFNALMAAIEEHVPDWP